MRFKNPLVLAWWLILLVCLQISSLILDRSHHLEWGRLGVHLIKAGYVGFAGVLFMRYLSFRSQRNFENLVESYNRVAKTVIEAKKIRKDSWLNPFLLLVLVIFSSVDFTLVFQWNEAVFKASVLLDFLVWMLIIRWLGRTFWLKSKGTRERLKEVLDDSRSRMKDAAAGPEIVENAISKTPFLSLSLIAFALSMSLSLERWLDIRDVFRIDNLKACMDQCMRRASIRFYQQGELKVDAAAEPCIAEREGKVRMSMSFRGGELTFRAVENENSDYFGNENLGDEALVLDATGRFHKTTTISLQADRK